MKNYPPHSHRDKLPPLLNEINHPVSAELSHPSLKRRGALDPINKMVFFKKPVRLSCFSRRDEVI
jgi:hypothetical protein